MQVAAKCCIIINNALDVQSSAMRRVPGKHKDDSKSLEMTAGVEAARSGEKHHQRQENKSSSRHIGAVGVTVTRLFMRRSIDLSAPRVIAILTAVANS